MVHKKNIDLMPLTFHPIYIAVESNLPAALHYLIPEAMYDTLFVRQLSTPSHWRRHSTSLITSLTMALFNRRKNSREESNGDGDHSSEGKKEKGAWKKPASTSLTFKSMS